MGRLVGRREKEKSLLSFHPSEKEKLLFVANVILEVKLHFPKHFKLYIFEFISVIQLGATDWLEKRGVAGCGAPSTARQQEGGW